MHRNSEFVGMRHSFEEAWRFIAQSPFFKVGPGAGIRPAGPEWIVGNRDATFLTDKLLI